MSDKPKTVQVDVFGTIPPYKPGDVAEIEVNAAGTPTDYHWRRRIAEGSAEIRTSKRASAKKPIVEPESRGTP